MSKKNTIRSKAVIVVTSQQSAVTRVSGNNIRSEKVRIEGVQHPTPLDPNCIFVSLFAQRAQGLNAEHHELPAWRFMAGPLFYCRGSQGYIPLTTQNNRSHSMLETCIGNSGLQGKEVRSVDGETTTAIFRCPPAVRLPPHPHVVAPPHPPRAVALPPPRPVCLNSPPPLGNGSIGLVGFDPGEGHRGGSQA